MRLSRQHMHDYRQRGIWLGCVLLVLFCQLALAENTNTSPLAQLRQELVDTIEELKTYAKEEYEDAIGTLVSELDHLQSVPGQPLDLEWEQDAPVVGNFTGKSFCFVVSSFEGLYINSGIGTAYYALAELLAAKGNRVTVLYTRDQPPATGSFNDWVKHYQTKGIQLQSLPPSDKRISNPKLQAISVQVYRYLKSNHFDFVHFADFEGIGFYSTLAKRVGLDFADTMIVVGLHGPTRWVLDANEGRVPTHESELEVDWMERMSVENADIVWSPSNALASWLSVQGWNFSRGVHLLPLPPGPEVRDLHVSTDIKAKELVFFGRLEKRKGLLLFLDSVDLFANMNNVPKHLTITFLGTRGFVDGQDSVEYIRSRAEAWPFKLNIITNATREAALGYLTERHTKRIPVIPSLIDNAPYTVYECLYAGIPFLASSTPSITPLLQKHEHHLFDPKPHHLASRMMYAVKTGLSSAKAVFSVQKAENTWNSFFSNVRLPQVLPTVSTSPLVTVCLIHFNRPQLVRQALASIQNQDYKKIEVILVDDGSNDTEAISYLESLQPSFDAQGWKIIRTTNRYLGAARNTAARNAQGEYLLFLDDDNVAFPHQISTYVKVAEKTKAQVVTAGHAVFKGTAPPNYENVDRFWLPLGPSLTVGLFKNCFGDANFFAQKDAFLSVGGFTEETNVGVEDHEFFAKAVFSGLKLEVIPEPLLYYRMHDEANQMLFTLDHRMGEVRRIRPYLDALTAPSKLPDQTKPEDDDDDVPAPFAVSRRQAETFRTRRNLVQLVARNVMSPNQDCNQTLSSISPTSGPIGGGTTITLTGVGFTCGVTAVRIGGQECTGISVVSNFEITCQTPSGSVALTPVDVTADVGGTTIALYSAWTYLPSAAPALNSCRLSDDGTFITCTFDSATSQTSGSCSTFFATETVSLLGTGANCFWVTSTNMEIDLGSGATIAVSDSISILAGVVSSQGDSTQTNEAGSVPLLAPLNPPATLASISAPSNVGSCQGITLDASASTGALGRTLTFTWSLSSVDPASTNVDAINQALSQANTANSNSVFLSDSDVSVGTYVFSLTVSNWIGSNNTATATVSKLDQAVPDVVISGPSLIQANRTQSLTLTAVVSSNCNTSFEQLSYLWSITPSVNIDASALTSTTLTVPADTFQAGTTYTISFNASDVTNPAISNAASVTVNVGVQALVAQIQGGDKQYQTSDTVSLDASASYDPEGLSTLTYSWSCASFYDASTPCSTSLPSQATVSFAGSSLGAGKYTITLTVSGSLSRTATASVWIEVTDVATLSISIQSLSSSTVDPSQSLSLVGVLNQQGVSEAEVTWSWTLVSGTLSNPNSSYLSGLDAQTLVIAANALTAGSQYTYKLSAVQTSTGTTGSATITFSVAKPITSGDLACTVTSGTAEDTDFTYDFGNAWGSTAGIVSYELRFLPSGGSLEIPLAEPSSATTFTTKLPYGKYTIIGIANSGNGVSARKECTADVTYSDLSTGLSTLASQASASGLDSFTIARYAYGAQAAFNDLGSSSNSNFDAIRSSLITALSSAVSSPTTSSVTADVGAFLVTTNPNTGDALAETDTVNAINALNSLVNAQASLTLNTSVLQAEVEVLSNLFEQVNNQEFQIKAQSKSQTTGSGKSDTQLWSAFEQLVALSGTLASQYLTGMSTGQSQVTISQAMVTLSLYTADTSSATSSGVTLGQTSTVKLSSGFVPSSVTSSTVQLVLATFGASPYPSSATIVSPVLALSVYSSGSVVDITDLPSPAQIYVPNSALSDNSNPECVIWSTSNSSWVVDGCTTTTSSGGVTCKCDSTGTYAVQDSTAAKAQDGGSGNGSGGLAGKWIGVIAGVGGVALVAVIVGSVIAVKRHRRPSATTAAATASAAPAPSSDAAAATAAAAAPAALSGVAVEPGTPASVSGSSYSSASSRSIVSSSSSEEEVMEQQIRDIVGELSTALPRDPRALEVLGDRLDME